MNKIIENGVFIAAAAFVAFTAYATITDSPRDELEARYASVEDISITLGFRCTAGRGRLTYNYRATNHNGDKVTGYICFTPSFRSPWTVPVIHESAK